MKTLAEWCAFAEAQADVIERQMEARHGAHRMPADRELTADWMMAEAALNHEALERTIKQFIETKEWPTLSDEEAFYLLHRLMLAQVAIGFHANGDAIALEFAPPPPSAAAEGEFIRWMLVDVWRARGAEQLRIFTSNLFRFVDESK